MISVGGNRHLILDPFQDSEFRDAGWEVIRLAQLDCIATLLRERSQFALPRLAAEGMSADAAFVDGSHVFQNVFVDLYYLQMIVRPGGLVILDDYWWPGVLRRLAILKPIWVGCRMTSPTALREDFVRCGCPIYRWFRDSRS